ncbi:hypothetical protein JAAARDRAFT_34630 [Jaapia argillacea MUCL 33604]|uniref:CHAT domain-containing protein n=1 Tax=Jaapia argillacea MUCL 33604 TaxID=933084 RepID=A0A067PY21_9AGAM|nr:hypothetical protein JAAARDRAFT_34630 [Jaapia argillacea MUCL 33604]
MPVDNVDNLQQDANPHGSVVVVQDSISEPRRSWDGPGLLRYVKNEAIALVNFVRGVRFWLAYYRGKRNPSDMDQCISSWQLAVGSLWKGHLGRRLVANSLGVALERRYHYSGDWDDINASVQAFEDALSECPRTGPSRLLCLTNLGDALQRRYSHLGAPEDIERSIEVLSEALELSQVESRKFRLFTTPNWVRRFTGQRAYDSRHASMLALGGTFQERFERSDNLADIQRALELLQGALDLTPPGHPNRPSTLLTLAIAYRAKSLKFGEISDFERTIEILEEALPLYPQSQRDRYLCLLSLGQALQDRYHETGKLEDVQRALDLFEEIPALLPEGDLEYYLYLRFSAEAQLLRFQELGKVSDLHNSIRMLNEAVEMLPLDHRRRADTVSTLCTALFDRFRQFRISADLSRVIELYVHVLDLRPLGHPRRVDTLLDLGNAELARYSTLSDVEYLPRSISRFSEAGTLLADGHALRGTQETLLGRALIHRYDLFNDPEDLDAGIKLHRQALQRVSGKLFLRVNAMSDLVKAISSRYRLIANIEDLDEAASLCQAILDDLCSPINPDRTDYLELLADTLVLRYRACGRQSDLDDAMNAFCSAVTHPFASAYARLITAKKWLVAINDYALHEQASIAYPLALDLVPQMMNGFAHLDSWRRLQWLDVILDLPCNAALHALAYLGQPKLAVEWMEQSRSIFWSQGLKLRTNFDGLPKELRQKLLETVQSLEASPEIRKTSIETAAGRTESEVEKAADTRRELVHQFDELVAQARKIEGFERFLMPDLYGHLAQAARNGPVVVLLASPISGCAAVVIPSREGEPVHVPLPSITFQSLKAMAERLRLANSGSRGMVVVDQHDPSSVESEGETRKMGVKSTWKKPKDAFEVVFEQMWSDVVRPILQTLALSKPADMAQRPRLWWCPAGPFVFLPLHAAGVRFGQSNRESTSDYVVSSYTPTLRSLIDAHDVLARRPPLDTKALLLAQPSTPRLPPLPNTTHEIDMLSKLFTSEDLLRIRSDASLDFTDSNSSVSISDVVDKLSDISILHLACHGCHDRYDPLESGFALQDGMLTVDKLIKAKTPNAFFAFLSACETASGDLSRGDESISLASAMLYAGFQSVVATMWPMGDSDGPVIAQHVYSKLLQAGGVINPAVIAFAVDEGVRSLQDRGIAPSRWAPYVHMGV